MTWRAVSAGRMFDLIAWQFATERHQPATHRKDRTSLAPVTARGRDPGRLTPAPAIGPSGPRRRAELAAKVRAGVAILLDLPATPAANFRGDRPPARAG
jgi:hypothetical protein